MKVTTETLSIEIDLNELLEPHLKAIGFNPDNYCVDGWSSTGDVLTFELGLKREAICIGSK